MTKLNEDRCREDPPASFYDVLRKALKKRKTVVTDNICPPADSVARRSSKTMARCLSRPEKVKTPPVCVFTSEEQVTKFQDEATTSQKTVSSRRFELQPEAMKALLKAREERKRKDWISLLAMGPRPRAELMKTACSSGTRAFCRLWIIGWRRDG